MIRIILLLTLAIHCDSYPACPVYWQRFNEACYVLVKSPATFFEAAAVCHLFEAHVVYINSAAEETFVQSLLLNTKIEEFWIGAQSLPNEAKWRWGPKPGGDIGQYMNWAVEADNFWWNPVKSDLYCSVQRHVWVKTNCREIKYFVCEKEEQTGTQTVPKTVTQRN